MTKKPKTIKGLIRSLERERNAIAKHRDALRELLDEVESMFESVNDGCEQLDYAVDALSQYA